LTQPLRDGEHEVGRGDSGLERAHQLDADDARQEHRDRLAEHRRFGLDAAHSPAEDAEPVDHRGVRVGADQRVGIRETAGIAEHHLRQVLQVHLVADAAVGREHAQGLEGLLRPAQERVALAVALELELGVARQRIGGAREVGDDRMVDHEVDGDDRLDVVGVAAEARDCVAQRGQVGDRGHAGEVLHQHARGHELDLATTRLLSGTAPVRDRTDVVGGDVGTVLAAQQILDQHA